MEALPPPPPPPPTSSPPPPPRTTTTTINTTTSTPAHRPWTIWQNNLRYTIATLLIITTTLNTTTTTTTAGIGGVGAVELGMVSTLPRKCERITIPMCQEVKYNYTKMPNLLGQFSQGEAAIKVHEYMPLVDIGCSQHLRFFLCSVYAPMCTPILDAGIPSCRSICLEVRKNCLPVLQKFNYTWPAALDCSRLPNPSPETLCMEPDSNSSSSSASSPLPDPRVPPPPPPPPPRPPVTSVKDTPPSLCPPKQTWVGAGGEGVCAPLCEKDVLFRRTDKHFAEVWLLVWAGLCFTSTLFTVLTFWLEPGRFRYPERPIICLSLCYLLYALAYLARLVAPVWILSCEKSSNGVLHLTVEGLLSSGCIITFILQYYFSLASGIWWVVLTFTWFLSAGKKWSSEALQAYASYFHTVAWGLPAVATILVLTLKQVDGDELVGLCYVGLSRRWAHLAFVIVPLSILLALGTFFIALGFVALFRIRRAIKSEADVSQADAATTTTTTTTTPLSLTTTTTNSHPRTLNNINKLEKLMVRIGVFSVLYTVPAICVISCNVYELMWRRRWREMADQAALRCTSSGYHQQQGFGGGGDGGWSVGTMHYHSGLVRTGDCNTLEQSIPSVEIFMLKIFMSLVVGITSGMWIWSSKTVTLWQKFFRDLCGRRSTLRKKDGNMYQPPAGQTQPQSIDKATNGRHTVIGGAGVGLGWGAEDRQTPHDNTRSLPRSQRSPQYHQAPTMHLSQV
ncbi:frizzled-10-B-like [Eriocheir sinensis]|uniref:frizzled-10-B-like n=1 Tax=Eriocheir sinensis TaxID=95602 RepID=UPI0021C9AC8C|nr:frizzled-10-B-like [Eriocheir sinensis]